MPSSALIAFGLNGGAAWGAAGAEKEDTSASSRQLVRENQDQGILNVLEWRESTGHLTRWRIGEEFVQSRPRVGSTKDISRQTSSLSGFGSSPRYCRHRVRPSLDRTFA